MLPKTIQLPKPKFTNIEEARRWAEDFSEFFKRFYSNMYNEFNESTKISVRGSDRTQLHGFFGSKDDME